MKGLDCLMVQPTPNFDLGPPISHDVRSIKRPNHAKPSTTFVGITHASPRRPELGPKAIFITHVIPKSNVHQVAQSG